MIKTAVLSFIAACVMIGQAQAGCNYTAGTQHVSGSAGSSATYEMASVGSLCAAAAPPILIIPGNASTIGMCLLAPAGTVKIYLLIRNGLWMPYAVPAVGQVGGTAEGNCFALPSAEQVKLVPTVDSGAEVGVRVTFSN